MFKKSLDELFASYYDVLKKSSICLLDLSNEMIDYYIYEELDINIRTFLYKDNLQKLLDEVMIDEEVYTKSTLLWSSFIRLIDTDYVDHRNAEDVRQSQEWKSILELSDEIKRLLISKKNNLEICFPEC